ncbi:uncharacterized protein LOC106460501 [Limulus polyphemus]|uniref:Uncharacterized protein LOC106460501 n=1 Tax=Limulus polyphemus TaxID=6850 RepID=A0ABM1B697_LIMPO|nr:uncharacterized protein LOC106460501 [Limulus polyphemus]
MASILLWSQRLVYHTSTFTKARIPMRFFRSSGKTWKTEADENTDEPIQYSTSKAAKWKARDTYGGQRDIPDCQPLVVTLSVAVFMIYFCILREENDIDEQMKKSIFEKIPTLKNTPFEKPD